MGLVPIWETITVTLVLRGYKFIKFGYRLRLTSYKYFGVDLVDCGASPPFGNGHKQWYS